MVTPDILPFYFNWEFWSAVVAVVALLKSEFPPVNSLFKRPKLDLEVNDRIWISHNAGNPNVSVFMSLSNVGNSDVSIASIQLLVSPSDGQQFELPAKSFYPSLTEEKWVIFSRFKLYAGTQWDHRTIFWKPF